MRKIRVAINGFGRIGRHACKILLANKNVEIVAINDLTDNATLAHLFKHDTAYPKFDGKVSHSEKELSIGRNKIPVFAQKDPSTLPWKKLKVDIVLECTGFFRKKEEAEMHITAGAKRVIISAPAKGDDVACFIRGVNCDNYKDEKVIDSGSCTTNSIAPVMHILEEEFGIEKAMLTTIHSYTSDQRLQDAPHKDLRRARAAAQNIIPTTTGAALATAKVVPSLQGNFDGIAVRVPTIVASLSDITIVLKKDVTEAQVNKALIKASKGRFKGILAVSDEPLVSSDYIGNPLTTVDLLSTKVVGGNLLKVITWYDNEWAYTNRLMEILMIVGKKLVK